MNVCCEQRGMTMVEMLVLIAIFSIIMLVIMESVSTFYRINENTLQQAYQVDNARRGIETFVRDIREMTFADDGTFPLAIMEDHRIGFYSDIDRDDSVEYVEYELVATTTLMKYIFNASGSPPMYDSVADETHTLSEYVQNLELGTSTFQYYDVNGDQVTAMSTVTDVHYITARLIVDVVAGTKPDAFILLSSAALRNLNEGL